MNKITYFVKSLTNTFTTQESHGLSAIPKILVNPALNHEQEFSLFVKKIIP